MLPSVIVWHLSLATVKLHQPQPHRPSARIVVKMHALGSVGVYGWHPLHGRTFPPQNISCQSVSEATGPAQPHA